MLSYSDFIDISVVSVPGPAIRGKAIGTIDAVFALSSLYNLIPKIISVARNKIIIEPATAKEVMSTPNKFNNISPK